MNSKQQKFIVTSEGVLRLGTVKQHCELLKPGEKCIGGGYYELDCIMHRLLLSGASSRYGEPVWEQLERLKVSGYYQGLRITYTSWDNWKEEFPVSDKLEIVYK